MTRQFAWIAVLLVGGTAVGMLLLALVFVPTQDWQTFVPIATIGGGVAVTVAVVGVEVVGEQLMRPVRRLVRAIEQDEIGEHALPELARQTPTEVAPLLYGLHVTHANLRRIVRQLERDRAEVEAIFEHMTDSVLVLDANERIVLCNPAATRMLGYAAPLGRGIAEVSRDAEIVGLAREAPDIGSEARLIELRVASGERRWIHAIATRLPEQRRLMVLQDVSELRRAEIARRDFVANVSHELRTPVAALKALVETLEQGAVDDPIEGPQFLHRMHVEVDGLAQLVAELLELARAEAGRLELHLTPCRADDLVREAAERIRPTTRQAQVELELALPSEELWVCADPRRMGQVLSNLLGNAAKFTPASGRIEAGARRHGASVELWVADTGVGIEPEHVGRVFERFYKTDPSRAAGTGTGLGLAIVKHLVMAQGGQVWAESEGPGRGSTFRVTLPAL